MLDPRVQVDLVRVSVLLQNLLRFVALLGREDGIGFGGGNGQRTGDARKLVFLDKRRVGKEANVDAALVVPGNVLLRARQYLAVASDPSSVLSPWHQSSIPARPAF